MYDLGKHRGVFEREDCEIEDVEVYTVFSEVHS